MLAHPEISIDYSLTYREFVRSYKLGARQSITTFFYLLLTRYVATVAALAMSGLIILSFFDGSRALVPKLLPSTLFLWFVPISVSWTWRKAFKNLKNSSGEPSLLTFQADRISFVRQIHGKGELTWLWSATSGIVKDSEMVLVMPRKGAVLMIPRHAISDAQISVLEEMWKQARKPA